MTRYYVDSAGAYKGGWDVPAEDLPSNPDWHEIEAPPEHAADVLRADGTWDKSGRPA